MYKEHCTYVYTSIYWELMMMWYYMVNHHETTYGSDQRPIPICVMSMEVCYDMMVHGQLSWNNIRPEPTLNTNMSNLVWMICIMFWFHMMVHGHHLNNMRPKPRPNTNMSNLVWMIGIGLIWWSMVITETTYDIIMKNTWSRPMPNTNMRDEYGGMLWYDGAWSVIMKS